MKFPGSGDMGKLLKQAQKMQADLAKAQEEIAQMEAEGSSGGGAVTARVNGGYELLSLKIDPAAIDPNDPETLEDLVLTAVNQAIKAVRSRSEERMAQVAGPMGGMMGL
jgi:hypothetical protein